MLEQATIWINCPLQHHRLLCKMPDGHGRPFYTAGLLTLRIVRIFPARTAFTINESRIIAFRHDSIAGTAEGEVGRGWQGYRPTTFLQG